MPSGRNILALAQLASLGRAGRLLADDDPPDLIWQLATIFGGFHRVNLPLLNVQDQPRSIVRPDIDCDDELQPIQIDPNLDRQVLLPQLK